MSDPSNEALAPYRIGVPVPDGERAMLAALLARTQGEALREAYDRTGITLRDGTIRLPATSSADHDAFEHFVGVWLHPIARAFKRDGEPDHAAHCAALGLRLALATLGSEHATTLALGSSLVSLLIDAKRSPEALPLALWIAAQTQRCHGPHHVEAATSASNLASCLYNLDRYAESLAHYERALVLAERLSGSESALAVAASFGVGLNLSALGRDDEALPHLERVYAVRIRVAGAHAPGALRAGVSLASCLARLERFEPALQLAAHLREEWVAIEGAEGPGTLDAMAATSRCLHGAGRHLEASNLAEQVLRARRKVLGPEHSDTLLAQHDLAQCLISQARYAEALPLLRHAVAGQARATGDSHPLAAMYLGALAICHANMGQSAEAWLHAERAEAILRQQFGPTNPRTLDATHLSAVVLNNLDRQEEALARFEAAAAGWVARLGEWHPRSLPCLASAAICLWRLGHPAGAARLLARTLLLSERSEAPPDAGATARLLELAQVLERLAAADTAEPHYRHLRAKGLAYERTQSLQALKILAEALDSMTDREQALVVWRGLAVCLGLCRVNGSLWFDHLETTARAIAEHAVGGRPGHWGEAFAAMARGLQQAVDLVPPEQDEALRGRLRVFDECYLFLCITLEQPGLIPTVLAARHGRRLARLCVEGLPLPQEQPRPAGPWERLRVIRAELRRLALGLKAFEKPPLDARALDADRAWLGTRDASRRLEQVDRFKILLDEYASTRAQLLTWEADAAAPLRTLDVDMPQLQNGLAAGVALVVLFESDAQFVQAPRAQRHHALVVTRDRFGCLPLDDAALDRAGAQASAWSRVCATRTGWRRGVMLASEAPSHGLSSPSGVAVEEERLRMRSALHDGFWRPLAASLVGIDELRIVTHGASHRLPLELGAPAGLRIRLYPGLVYYHRLHHQARVGSRAATGSARIGLAVNASHGAVGVNPIPFVDVESRLVRAVWPGEAVTDHGLLEDSPGPDVMHFAAHGQLDDHDPARSNLMLADGLLDLQTVLAARRCPRVVFLSACTVGRTTDDPDGEPLGLVGGFLIKGARYVIAALQPVPDFYMPLFGALFHQAWCGGDAPAAALTEAKRRFAAGDWFADTEALVREHYRPTIVECLAEAMKHEAEPPIEQALAAATHDWPWPAPYRALRPGLDDERLQALREQAATVAGREALADAVLDTLIAERDALPESVVDTMCTWLVGFGDAD